MTLSPEPQSEGFNIYDEVDAKKSTAQENADNSRFDWIFVSFCLCVTFGLRLGVIFLQSEQLTIERDAYIGIATSVAEGRGYCGPGSTIPTAFRPPIYPLALALGLLQFPAAPVVATINLISGVLTVWLMLDIGKRLGLGKLSFLAAAFVIVDPVLLQYAARPMTESICTFLATAWLWSVVLRWQSQSDFRQPMICGIVFGVLVLSRPTFWPIAGFYVLLWLVPFAGLLRSNVNLDRVSRFGQGISAACGTAIVVVPWMVRNWLVLGVPILTTTHGGYTLLLGNNPVFYNEVVQRPWGTIWSDESFRRWENESLAELDHDLGKRRTEIEDDAWYGRKAKLFISAQPWCCAQAAFHRIRSLWNTSPQGDAAQGVQSKFIVLTGWFYAFELTLGFLGMIIIPLRRGGTKWLPLYILIISVQLVHLLYWTNTRMRAPLTPSIALFAAATMSSKSRRAQVNTNRSNS